MPRRRKNQANVGAVLGAIILCLFVISVVQSFRSQDALFFVIAVGFIAVSILVLKMIHTRSRHDAFLAQVDQVADRHMDALIRQRAILIRSDPYGKPILDKWHSELEYFATNHLQPTLSARQLPLLASDRDGILQRIDLRVFNVAQSRPAFVSLSPAMTPAAFEAYCADQLRICGWTAHVTPSCRDQGVDVIAEKSGVRIVLQCKLYSNPVGNKAVQEIAAGRAHQQAHYGAVVTNNAYTPSARQLAQTNGILLLHHSELANLDGRLVVPSVS
jgi:restriction system protein